MRYFVEHGMIHDRETGKHVSQEEAAAMLSAMPAIETSEQRIAWGVVVELGRMLGRAEDRIAVRDFTIDRVREYAQYVSAEPLGMESINADMAALVEQARKYVADVVLTIVGSGAQLAKVGDS